MSGPVTRRSFASGLRSVQLRWQLVHARCQRTVRANRPSEYRAAGRRRRNGTGDHVHVQHLAKGAGQGAPPFWMIAIGLIVIVGVALLLRRARSR